jgi:hypothetical protein
VIYPCPHCRSPADLATGCPGCGRDAAEVVRLDAKIAYVNMFDVARYSPFGYAGAVCAVTAAVAVGYEHVTGLIDPRSASDRR